MSGSVIFDLFGIREKEGDYILFIVVTNFVAGFLYLLSVYGLLALKPWAFRLLLFITGILVVAFIVLMIYVNQGGIHEAQTIKAMIFRIALSSLFAGIAWRYGAK